MRSFEERIAEINRRSDKIIKERKKRRQRILTACIPVVLGTTLLIALFPGGSGAGDTLNSTRAVAKVIVVGDDCYRYHSGKKNVMEIYDQLQAFEQHENKEEKPTEAPSNGGSINAGAPNGGNTNGSPYDDPHEGSMSGSLPEQEPSGDVDPPTNAVPDDPYSDYPMHGGSMTGTEEPPADAAPPDDFDIPMDAGPSGDDNLSKPTEDVRYFITLTLSNGKTARYLLTGNTLTNMTTKQETDLTDDEMEELKTLLGISNL